jgi:trimethylamine--corrinoid protein Co-methyltransferase
MDFKSFEQWSAEGESTAQGRALARAKNLLESYEEPKLDEAKHEALREFVAKRERELPDTVT